jgi:hypothetical protein
VGRVPQGRPLGPDQAGPQNDGSSGEERGQPEFGLKFVETIGVFLWQHIVFFEKPKKGEKKTAVK